MRKLNQSDHENIMKLLSKKPAENLFTLWGIEAYGYEADIQTLWGQFDSDGELNAVLCKFKNKYTPYWETGCNVQVIADIINANTNEKQVNGIERLTKEIGPLITDGYSKRESYYYAKCDPTPNHNHSDSVRCLSKEEIPQLISFYQEVPEFKREYNPESFIDQMNNGWSRIFVIEEDNKLISSASTVCETSVAAMVSGVCTLPAKKGKGLASICIEHLMYNLFQENKTLTLFYDNPEAGRIYKRLGFKDIEKWTINSCEERKNHHDN
ncbi:GNAT family N-acetyltransferase [Fictibacillus norfolkensis]|uniref:GNAT family N-acetyltransferase n=1 Tax=Fictibacillus norfolkensis TaxID=2762233 RepID=A0ABR8SJP0_9BACL|nr:GNAT family N-acetyltransferase [Fictibacillus norfolkensis]MBD7963708.1 GNAT family N-acetyltransferase [Fictibacillus norfolkensis]